MLCIYPILVRNGYGYVQYVPCGQCIPCRLNKIRQLVARCLLEEKTHEYSYFITLTYKETENDGNLHPSHVDSFFKKIRKRGYKIRYIYCGEYGDESYRPHYHAIIWCDRPLFEELVLSELWTAGFSYLGTVTADSIRYVVGYVEKKAIVPESFWREKGLLPEFRRFSRRPGLGVNAWKKICDLAFEDWKKSGFEDKIEMPRLIFENKEWPVDRHLKEIFYQRFLGKCKKKSLLQVVAEDIQAARADGSLLHGLKRTEVAKRLEYKHKLFKKERKL